MRQGQPSSSIPPQRDAVDVYVRELAQRAGWLSSPEERRQAIADAGRRSQLVREALRRHARAVRT